MTFSKFAKWTAWLIGTLIIGGLGNGVWEKFLSPFLIFLSEKIINLLSNLSTTYSDALYTSISSSLFFNTNSRLYSAQIIFIALIIIIAHFYVFKFLPDKKIPKVDFVLFFILILILFFASTFNFSRLSFINNASTNSHMNLEIIRPYIGEQKYLELRSYFFRIKTKKDFDNFEEKIITISNEKNLKLNKFSGE